MTRIAHALGGISMLLSAIGCAPGAPPPIPLNPVRFLLINDIATRDTMANGRGGLARVATTRRRIATQGPVLFVAAGNVLFDSTRAATNSAVAALNAAKLDYATFTAEALMLPPDTLAARVTASSLKWLSANCSGIPGVRTWDTVRVSTHKVGIFGLTQPGTYGTLRCTDPDSAARRIIDSLVADSVGLIVAVTHLPSERDRALLLRESRLDLILGGGEYAQQTVVAGRYVLKADSNASTAQFITLWGGKGQWRQAVGQVPVDARLPADTVVLRAERTKPD